MPGYSQAENSRIWHIKFNEGSLAASLVGFPPASVYTDLSQKSTGIYVSQGQIHSNE
jgi:hypothetical protein